MKIPSRPIDAGGVKLIQPTTRAVLRLLIDFVTPRIAVIGADMGKDDGKLVKVREVNRVLIGKDAAAFIEAVDVVNVSVQEAALDVLDAPQPDNTPKRVAQEKRGPRPGIDVGDDGTKEQEVKNG